MGFKIKKLVSFGGKPNRREREGRGKERRRRRRRREEEEKRRREKKKQSQKGMELTLGMNSSMDHMEFI